MIWAGDADWICNWMGNQAAVEAVSFSGQEEFQGKEMKPYTVGGTQTGTFKSVGNFSFLRVFEAGHEVPYYRMLSGLFPLSTMILTRYRAGNRAPSLQADHKQAAAFLYVIPSSR